MLYVDIVGFCRIANPTTFMKSNRDWEPEMRLLFGVYDERLGWSVSKLTNANMCVYLASLLAN